MFPSFPLLRFAWWNVHNFAHFDVNHSGEDRWPLDQAEYDEKCKRVDSALRDLITRHPPDILGLCEITSAAAVELQARLFPGYEVAFPDAAQGATLQVAVLYRSATQFRELEPLLATKVPRTTRGMAIVDHLGVNHCIRFIFCHWTAFGDKAHVYRQNLAEAAREHAYDFLHDRRRTKAHPHVVILGDLNEEPFSELFQERLHAFRDRERSHQRAQAIDQDIRRVLFYNASWRLLGERHPHDPTTSRPHFAGTYFNADDRAWHTYDQLLVTGELLEDTPPYLAENSFGIMPLQGCLGPSGRPEPFRWENGAYQGLSDHLPLVGQFVLPVG